MQDYEDFDLANEIDELEKFLKVTTAVSTAEITLDSKPQSEIQENGNTSSREVMLFLYLVSVQEIKIASPVCLEHVYVLFLRKKIFGSAKIEIATTVVMFIV